MSEQDCRPAVREGAPDHCGARRRQRVNYCQTVRLCDTQGSQEPSLPLRKGVSYWAANIYHSVHVGS